jgi:hypothetical protein
MVFVVGPTDFYLRYQPQKNFWSAHKFDQDSAYKGTSKYVSLCRLGQLGMTDQLFLSGGCNWESGEPTD